MLHMVPEPFPSILSSISLNRAIHSYNCRLLSQATLFSLGVSGSTCPVLARFYFVIFAVIRVDLRCNRFLECQRVAGLLLGTLRAGFFQLFVYEDPLGFSG